MKIHKVKMKSKPNYKGLAKHLENQKGNTCDEDNLISCYLLSEEIDYLIDLIKQKNKSDKLTAQDKVKLLKIMNTELNENMEERTYLAQEIK